MDWQKVDCSVEEEKEKDCSVEGEKEKEQVGNALDTGVGV